MSMRHRMICASALVCALAGGNAAAGAQLPASETSSVLESLVGTRIPTSAPPDVLLADGQALYDAGRFKEAAASFEQAMQAGVKRPHEAAWNVARSYARLGNRKQALRWAKIAELLGSPNAPAGSEGLLRVL